LPRRTENRGQRGQREWGSPYAAVDQAAAGEAKLTASVSDVNRGLDVSCEMRCRGLPRATSELQGSARWRGMRPDKGHNEALWKRGEGRREDSKNDAAGGQRGSSVRRREVSGVWPKGGWSMWSLSLSRSLALSLSLFLSLSLAIPGASRIDAGQVDG